MFLKLQKQTNLNRNIESGGDNTALVDATSQLDDDLAGAVVINNLELTNIAFKLNQILTWWSII
jgi:hypothetical protein